VSSEPALRLNGVVKRFGKRAAPVLDGVDLAIDRGESVAIQGASGTGKSTLLHLIAALDRPTRGEIIVNGKNLQRRFDINRYRRLEVGIIFQLHNLIPRLTATENVEIAMLGTRRSAFERRERAAALLHRLGLDHAVRRDPTRLSGGERQRVAIARALANEPSILLADEPTGSLDPEAAQLVLDLFDELRRDRQTTIVLVTHDPLVAATATRSVHLAGGKLTGLPKSRL
jgi:ABC-type lipoprotein export system ATPase subunit